MPGKDAMTTCGMEESEEDGGPRFYLKLDPNAFTDTGPQYPTLLGTAVHELGTHAPSSKYFVCASATKVQ